MIDTKIWDAKKEGRGGEYARCKRIRKRFEELFVGREVERNDQCSEKVKRVLPIKKERISTTSWAILS